ncbi:MULTISPECIES: integrase domain-containing protein [Marinobacter]|uniref:integrase domain-containing protein n=1 Tax=Marinobacter TaxID=2742 RepID=UPI0012461801|nr:MULTISPECIES: integrase domain-containing protein [Marinobacter]MBL3556345.1 integrase domain-containing protein [Marinobacter sp. JB05H06]
MKPITEKHKARLVAAASDALELLVRDGAMSFSTKATLLERWAVFCDHLIENTNISVPSAITRKCVIDFGCGLEGRYSAAYAQNLVSSVNSVMKALTFGKWDSISPTIDCDLPKRTHVRTEPPSGLNESEFFGAVSSLELNGLSRGAIIALACRSLGLRCKEAALLNYKEAEIEAKQTGYITVQYGTKGGRARKVKISSEDEQLAVLVRGSAAQGDHFSLVPAEQSWKEFRDSEIHQTRTALKKAGIARIHDLRAGYACIRYKQLTGYEAPILGGHAPSAVDSDDLPPITKPLTA